jgi:Protein of unknown function (DUF3228)
MENLEIHIEKLLQAAENMLSKPGMLKGRTSLQELVTGIRTGTNTETPGAQCKKLIDACEFALTTPGMIRGRGKTAGALETFKQANMKIIISPFCSSRDQGSCTVPLENKLPEILRNLPKAKMGYREGVLLVPIGTENFIGQIRTLQPGDALSGSYKARKEGETPRKEIRVAGMPNELVSVDVVLYSRETLAEGGENSDMTADYEVITFLTKISDKDQPMPPETLMANHFLDSGGTSTNMGDFEFVKALRESYEFWRGRALITPAASGYLAGLAHQNKTPDAQ